MHDYPITRYIGFAIIVLAVLEVFDITNFKPLFLLGFSFSALFLTFVDFIEIKADEKNDPFKYKKIKFGVLFLAICFFIIVPNLSIEVSDEILGKLNNIAVLLSIGLLFVIIGYKQEKMVNNNFLKMMNDMINEILAKEVGKMAVESVENLLKEKNLTEEVAKTIDKIEKERSGIN